MPETDLHISERLRKLLPSLTSEERKQLKANIESDGRVQDKILWWNDGERNVVCDGMHRWEIVRGTDIPYETSEMHFTDYEEVEIWILNHQLGRRNLLKPSDIRKIVGELYNRLKSQRGGDHTAQSERAKGQNDTLVSTSGGKAAAELAEKAGVSASTVKRHGARVEAESKLSKAAQFAAEKLTDADVKILAKLDFGTQDQVARHLRTGQAKTVKEAMKLSGFKPPEASKPDKPKTPPKKYDRSFWYKQWNTSIGPLCRLVDKIGTEVGEIHGARHKAVKAALETATQNMIDWMGVKR